MSDNNNNQNQEDGFGTTSQPFNRSSSYNPSSSDLNYGNNYSSYNRSPSYGSYNNDSYGSYGSGYSGYSGYGGTSGYGGYGGSSYGGYNRGYSSYGGANQYSNHYSKPLPPNQQGEQGPPPNFRQDMWGFLNGFHAMLNVLYAATGIVHFGKIFMKMSLKIIKMICGKSIGLVFKLTGFKFLKKILMGLSTTDNWSSEFNFTEQPFENAWGNGGDVNNSTIFGKIILVLRVCSLLGTGLALFLRSKMRNQHPPVQAEVLGPDVFPNDIPQKPTDFERVKSFYEDIKLIEEDKHLDVPLTFSAIQDQQEIETFVQVVEEADKSLELAPEEEPIKALVESTEDNSENLVGSQTQTEQEEKAPEVIEAVVESINVQVQKTAAPLVIEKIEQIIPAPIIETPIEPAKFDITASLNSSSTTKESLTSTPQDSLVSEDFWKNQEIYKTIENIQKEEKKPDEAAKKEFEMPSVLKSLKSAGANKPWLMKKKKPVEAPVETPVENPVQAQTSQVEIVEKTPEVQNVAETRVEKVTETPVEAVEVPKVESQLENVEAIVV